IAVVEPAAAARAAPSRSPRAAKSKADVSTTSAVTVRNDTGYLRDQPHPGPIQHPQQHELAIRRNFVWKLRLARACPLAVALIVPADAGSSREAAPTSARIRRPGGTY